MSHEKHGDTKGPGNIIIRGNSTDIFIILLESVQTFLKSHLWLDIRLDYVKKLSRNIHILFTSILQERESQAHAVNNKKQPFVEHLWLWAS